MRIIHCPKNIGGHPAGISKAERAMGLDSRSVALIAPAFDFKADEILWRRRETPLKLEYNRWKLFLRAILFYDVIHFNFGMTFMPEHIPLKQPENFRKIPRWLWLAYRAYSNILEFKDLPLLKFFGKKIFVTFQGSDIRLPDFCRKNCSIHYFDECEMDEEYINKINRKKIDVFSKYADALFTVNPDLMHILPSRAEFVPYAHINPNEFSPSYPDFSDNHRPRILHAPSKRNVKGTGYILEALDKLKAEGIDFEFLLIEDMPNNDAMKHYQKADLLIDQLLAGWYGGLSGELMAMGKPVFCYIREDDLKFIPEEMQDDMPIINISKETLYFVLKHYLTSGRDELSALGIKSRKYVEHWHDPIKITRKLAVGAV